MPAWTLMKCGEIVNFYVINVTSICSYMFYTFYSHIVTIVLHISSLLCDFYSSICSICDFYMFFTFLHYYCHVHFPVSLQPAKLQGRPPAGKPGGRDVTGDFTVVDPYGNLSLNKSSIPKLVIRYPVFICFYWSYYSLNHDHHFFI